LVPAAFMENRRAWGAYLGSGPSPCQAVVRFRRYYLAKIGSYPAILRLASVQTCGAKTVYPTNPIIWLILEILNIYTIVIIVAVVVSWLVAFNVINLYNAFIRSVVRILDALTEPVFALVRKVIPSIAGLDLSPLIVLLAVYFLQYSVGWFAFRMGI